MHARVQWKVHRRNVIIIVARFAYVTGWLAGGDEGSAGRSVGRVEEPRGGGRGGVGEQRGKVGKGEATMTGGRGDEREGE